MGTDHVYVGPWTLIIWVGGFPKNSSTALLPLFPGYRPEKGIADRGYRGRKHYGSTELLIPAAPKSDATDYARRQAKKRFRRRAAIEPRIGHLKSDFRLGRNFLRGVNGDAINLLLAATAANLSLWLRRASACLATMFARLLSILASHPSLRPQSA